MSTKTLIKGQYTTFGPDEIWTLYNNLHGIFRGGGNTSSPKLTRAAGLRKTDLRIVYDPIKKQEMVHPDKTKGLSFADSIETLADKKLEGWVWRIPKGKTLPKDLTFNVKDFNHPLLNVSRIMSVSDMTELLVELAKLMEPCYVKIGKMGNIIEKHPGALVKVQQK